jgi:hypothetical protein
VELHDRLTEADPGEHAAHETVALRHGEETIERLAVDEPKIADIARDFDVAELGEQAVEEIGGDALEAALALARQPLGVDDLVALFPLGDHVEDDFGRVLQVGVHDDDRAAHGVLHARGDRDLVAEIARQLDEAITLVGAGLGFEDNRPGVAGPIIDEDHLGGRVERVEQRIQPPQQNRQNGFLVVDRQDQRIDGAHGGAGLGGDGSR